MALRRLDPSALGDHVDRLYRAAWALCGDPHDAEDLVQETYARVLARPRFLRREDDLAYLLRALRNVHANRWRAASRRPQESELFESVLPAPEADLRRPERAYEVTELFAAIAALPPEGAEAVVAVDVVGLSYREAARALGIAESALTMRLHRARRRVAAAIEAEAAA